MSEDPIKKTDQDYRILSHNIDILNENREKNEKASKQMESGSDTSDLTDDSTFNFKELKSQYLNNLVSWSFLKKVSELFQWPIGCLGNLIDNSIIHGESTKIEISVNCYDKKVYTRIPIDKDPPEFKKMDDNILKYNDFSDKQLVLSIKDNGKGIDIETFNKILFSFSSDNSKNDKLQDYFYQFGVTMKASCLRMANSFFIISKTKDELSLGLITKNLQLKLNVDSVITPILNYKHSNNNFYFQSQYSMLSANLILNEIKFLFYDLDEINNYALSFDTGTHIFLYDFKQFTGDINRVGLLKNFELYFDAENKDILYNLFYLQTQSVHSIDVSLRNYIENLYLKNFSINKNVDISLFGEKINLNNQLETLHDNYKELFGEFMKNFIVINNSNFGYKFNDDCKEKIKCVIINCEIYNGVLLMDDKEFISNKLNDIVNYQKLQKNILLYLNKKLVCSLEQKKFGDVSYYLNNYSFKKNKIIGNNKWIGYIELPSSMFELVGNKTEFKDQVLYSYFYSKIINLIKKINSFNNNNIKE